MQDEGGRNPFEVRPASGRAREAAGGSHARPPLAAVLVVLLGVLGLTWAVLRFGAWRSPARTGETQPATAVSVAFGATEAYPPPWPSNTPEPTALPNGQLVPPANIPFDTMTISESPRRGCLGQIALGFEQHDPAPILDILHPQGVSFGDNWWEPWTSNDVSAMLDALFDAGSEPVIMGYLDGAVGFLYSTGWAGNVPLPASVTPYPGLRQTGSPPTHTGPTPVASWNIQFAGWDDQRCWVRGMFFGTDFYGSMPHAFEDLQNEYERAGGADAVFQLEQPIYHMITGP